MIVSGPREHYPGAASPSADRDLRLASDALMRIANMIFDPKRDALARESSPPSLVSKSSHSPRPRAGPSSPARRSPEIARPAALRRDNSSPRSPLSPPVDDASKPSLPSISSLFGIADEDRRNRPAPPVRPTSRHNSPLPPVSLPESRVERSPRAIAVSSISHAKPILPPTPPMRQDFVAEGSRSPSIHSCHSSASAPSYPASHAGPNMFEPRRPRGSADVSHTRNPSAGSQPAIPTTAFSSASIVTNPPPTAPAYAPDYRPMTSSGLQNQRPLPTAFPPAPPSLHADPPTSSTSSGWQHMHHHYIGASSQAAFPQPQDRYICGTCNKAFSRPSSLRIHSHSHTGEKPFKCPQPGCEKAFSVRSNMKRHERGCHAGSERPSGSS